MLKKYGVGITSGYTVDRKVLMSKNAIINSYIDSYADFMLNYINHDRTRPLSYSKIDLLYFGFDMVYLTLELNFPENEEDNQKLLEVNDLITQRKESHIEMTKYDILLSSVKGAIKGDVYFLGDYPSVALYNKGIVDRLFSKDDISNKLIDVSLFKISKNGSFIFGDYLVYPHKFFRRSQYIYNTLNQEFITQMIELSKDESLSVTIALDSDVIGLIDSDTRDMEFQYWWGPKFKNNLITNSGVTVHSNDDEKTKLFNRVNRSEFRWYEQGGLKTFECEELVEYTINIDGENYIPNRFIHSMLNKDLKPNHIDGAIRNYTIEEYEERLNNDISRTGRNTLYKKIFRVDGVISIEQWKNLVTHYYRDNTLVGEYLGGVDEILTEKKDDLIASNEEDQFLKFKIGDGIRMAFKLFDNEKIHLENESITMITESVKKVPEITMIDNYLFNSLNNQKISRSIYESGSIENGLFQGASLYILYSDEQLLKFNVLLKEIPDNFPKDMNISFAVGKCILDKTIVVAFTGCVQSFKSIDNLIYSFPKSINNCTDWLIKMDSRNKSISKETKEKLRDVINIDV